MKLSLLFSYSTVLFYYCTCKQYRSFPVTVNVKCNNTELPYIAPIPFDLDVGVYAGLTHNLMSMNLTVHQDIPGKDKQGYFQLGKKTTAGIKWLFTLNNLTCFSAVVRTMFKVIDFQHQDCYVRKGHYFAKDIDFDALESVMSGGVLRPNGLYVSKAVVYSKTHTYACIVSNFKIAPLNVKKNKRH